jgi:hypothetical protein
MRRVAQRFDAFCRSIDDRLFVDIEARVDEDRKAHLALERAEDIVVEVVVRRVDNLRPCRMVDVYYERATPEARRTLSPYSRRRAD